MASTKTWPRCKWKAVGWAKGACPLASALSHRLSKMRMPELHWTGYACWRPALS